MKSNRLIVFAVLLSSWAVPLGGQDTVGIVGGITLTHDADQNLTALRKAEAAVSSFELGDALAIAQSPDAEPLRAINEAAHNGEDHLRSITDLLGVYDNLQSEQDRLVMRPLLADRLKLYSVLLANGSRDLEPYISLNPAKLATTVMRAQRLREALFAAKARLDAVSVP